MLPSMEIELFYTMLLVLGYKNWSYENYTTNLGNQDQILVRLRKFGLGINIRHHKSNRYFEDR